MDSALAPRLFAPVASVNRRRATLLVGANAVAARGFKTEHATLDLLDPGHPERQLLSSPEPLPFAVLDHLGPIGLRE